MCLLRSARPRLDRSLAWLLPSVAVAVIAWAGDLSGALADTFTFMGLDPDRAALVDALIIGALVGAAGACVSGSRLGPTVAALAASLAWFTPTYVAAVSAAGRANSLFAAGAVLTAAALVVVALATGWASAVVAAAVRVWILDAREARRLLVLRSLWLALTLGAFLVLGQLLSYTVDTLFRGPVREAPTSVFGDGSGAAPNASPLSTPTSPEPAPMASIMPTALAAPTPTPTAAIATPTRTPAFVAGPRAGSLITTGAVSNATPWAGDVPSGNGRVVTEYLSAPWVEGRSSVIELAVYLPPGYDQNPARRYPLIVEVPWPLVIWNDGAKVIAVLDGMIAAGSIPPAIVAFASTLGGPYVPAECADSKDGREHMETYLSKTLIAHLDATYRTIPRAAARATLGFSEGGFCAPMLVLRHTSVYASAIVLSGYFEAGLRTAQTANAWRPFGGDAALERAYSPLSIDVPASVRASLFLVLCAGTDDPIYGDQYARMVARSTSLGIPIATLPSELGHREQGHDWPGVRTDLPVALRLLAARWVETAVVG